VRRIYISMCRSPKHCFDTFCALAADRCVQRRPRFIRGSGDSACSEQSLHASQTSLFRRTSQSRPATCLQDGIDGRPCFHKGLYALMVPAAARQHEESNSAQHHYAEVRVTRPPQPAQARCSFVRPLLHSLAPYTYFCYQSRSCRRRGPLRAACRLYPMRLLWPEAARTDTCKCKVVVAP